MHHEDEIPASARPSHLPLGIAGLPRSFASDSGARLKIPPYSRAAATVFHRLPVRGVSGDCGRRRENSTRAAYS